MVKKASDPYQLASGSKVEDFQRILLWQARNPIKIGDEEALKLQEAATISAMAAIKPKDELEGMFAAQIVTTHNAAMECFRRASDLQQTTYGRELNLKYADKLMRTYANLVAALDKHRGKGQQKMTVEHVTVNKGGQAIVGNVEQKQGGS